jgi:hypothetical protein
MVTRMLSTHSWKTAELHNFPVLGWLLEVLIAGTHDQRL